MFIFFAKSLSLLMVSLNNGVSNVEESPPIAVSKAITNRYLWCVGKFTICEVGA